MRWFALCWLFDWLTKVAAAARGRCTVWHIAPRRLRPSRSTLSTRSPATATASPANVSNRVALNFFSGVTFLRAFCVRLLGFLWAVSARISRWRNRAEVHHSASCAVKGVCSPSLSLPSAMPIKVKIDRTCPHASDAPPPYPSPCHHCLD